MSAPHFPTSAELAAFRQDVGFAPGADWGPLIHPTDPETCEETGHAWPHEREHGIGWDTRWACEKVAGHDHARPTACDARREANRLRHKAYERQETGS